MAPPPRASSWRPLPAPAGELAKPAVFRAHWPDPTELIRSPGSAVEALRLSDARASSFLAEVGLPGDAAPFLSFRVADSFPSVAEDLGLDEDSGDFEVPLERLHRCRVIGSTGSGDPLCIEEGGDARVFGLNHDRGLEEYFVNSSLPQLAAFLLCFAHLVAEANRVNGSGAYLDGNFPEGLLEHVMDAMKAIDPAACLEGYWAQELEELA